MISVSYDTIAGFMMGVGCSVAVVILLSLLEAK